MEEKDTNEMKKSIFNTLYELDTRDRAKEKDTGRSVLSYLPWATAYSEACKRFEHVEYDFLKDEIEVEEEYVEVIDDKTTKTTKRKEKITLPYFETPIGLEVRTYVAIDGVTKYMSLPVYDSSYKAMSLEPYTYPTKNGQKTVPAARLDDVYKSIMRCFAKNLAMFGVGLNLWTKEDIPETVREREMLQAECLEIIKKKCDLSEATKKAVGEICKEMLPDENGDPKLCDDNETLKKLLKKLKTLRKM